MESIFPWPPKQGVFLSKTGGRRPELEKTTPPPHGASQTYRAASGLGDKYMCGLKHQQGSIMSIF